MDPSAEFEDYDDSVEEESDEEFIKSMFEEMAINEERSKNAKHNKMKDVATMIKSSKNIVALLSKVQKEEKKNSASITHSGGRLSSGKLRRDAGRKKDGKQSIDRQESEVRQRLKKRHFFGKDRQTQLPHSLPEGDAMENTEDDAIARAKRHKKKILEKYADPHGHRHQQDKQEQGLRSESDSSAKKRVDFGTGKSYGWSAGAKKAKEDSGDETKAAETASVDGYDSASMDSRSVSRTDIGKKVKPLKSPLTPYGVFGPKGYKAYLKDHASAMQKLLMGPDDDNTSLKRRQSIAARKAQERKRREEEIRKKKQIRESQAQADAQRMLEYIVDSDEDPDAEDDEAFKEMKKWKLEGLEDDKRSQYVAIEEVFEGSGIHELTEMHMYERNPYAYHQFELVARHQFIRQMWLLSEETSRMKQMFNKLFDDARYWKISTIKKMAQRNKRIREIYYYLKLDLDILDEQMDPREDPMLIFTVDPSEIPVEKYLTAEQKRLEQLRLAAARAKKNTRMAKFRRRALRAMMDGKLETKREELLLRDVPKPNFMAFKDVMEYSLDEFLESMEYQKKVEDLEIERAGLIKELEAELYKLYRQNAFDFNGAELRVQELYLAKLQFHYNIVMEETKIQRILRLVRITDDCLQEEDRVKYDYISL
jgi:hypothetical protein